MDEDRPSGELALTDDFKILWRQVPIEEARAFLLLLVSEGRIPFGDGLVVLLEEPAVGGQRAHWFGPRKLSGTGAQREVNNEETCWLMNANGPNQHEIIANDDYEKLCSIVRLRAPVYANLESLLYFYAPGIKIHPNLTTVVNVVAPLPFRVRYESKYGHKGRIYVRAPKKALGDGLFVLAYTKGFIQRKELVTSVEKSEQEAGEYWRQFFEFEWPSAFTKEGVLHLYYGEEEVDQTNFWRWPFANTLASAVDEFFDGGHYLDQWLFRHNEKGVKPPESRQFEHAIVRLLIRSGIPAVWYGEKVYGNRPDIAAAIEWADPPTILIGECTLRDPLKKISDFSNYRELIRKSVGADFRYLSALFTPVPTTNSDSHACSEAEVALVGREELSRLHGMVGWKEQTLDYLFRLAGR